MGKSLTDCLDFVFNNAEDNNNDALPRRCFLKIPNETAGGQTYNQKVLLNIKTIGTLAISPI